MTAAVLAMPPAEQPSIRHAARVFAELADSYDLPDPGSMRVDPPRATVRLTFASIFDAERWRHHVNGSGWSTSRRAGYWSHRSEGTVMGVRFELYLPRTDHPDPLREFHQWFVDDVRSQLADRPAGGVS